MFYVWLAQGHDAMLEPVVGATADGRKQGGFFSSSLAPSPGVRVRGPFSVFKSYSKINYQRICNGGPLTLEVSDTVFRNPEAVHQVALFIRLFATMGCQQLQINTLNVESLKDAQLHPEVTVRKPQVRAFLIAQQGVDGRDIGERSDAVLRTAMPRP